MEKFIWKLCEAGYAWEVFKRGQEGERLLVVNRPWPVRETEPLAQNTALFRKFVALDTEPEAILGFANEHGHLGNFLWTKGADFKSERAKETNVLNAALLEQTKADPAQLGQTRAESLSFWIAQIAAMRAAFETWEAVNAEKCDPDLLQEVAATIDRECRDRVKHQFAYDKQARTATWSKTPVDLLGSMWFRFGEVFAEGKQIRQCAVCSEWFEVAPGTGRADKKHCSLACRQRAYQGRRQRAIELRSQGQTVEQIAQQLESDAKTVRGWLKKGGQTDDDGDVIHMRGLDL